MPIKLTKDTLKDMLSGILIQSLPLTFQHAITLTRRLGKRYLWIDCMCIFQDVNDNSDWLNEAPIMDRVYTNTFVNISATGITDSEEGLFVFRDAELELPEVSPTVVTCRPSSKWLSSPTELIINEFRMFEEELDEAALNNRGWVFQERWLAPRILHFGRKQIFWECRKHLLCERYPYRLPDHALAVYGSGYRKSKLLRCGSMSNQTQNILFQEQESLMGDIDQAAFLEAWGAVVRYYSATQFSYETDRVMALSGIVNVIKEATGDQYLAGFWRHSLEQQPGQLAWRTDHDETQFRQSRCRIAPTWSWLSAESPIHPSSFEPHDPVYVKVLSVSVEHVIQGNSGTLLRGLLTVKGRLFPVNFSHQSFSFGRRAERVHVRGHPGQWEPLRDEGRLTVPFPAKDCFGIVVGTRAEQGQSGMTTACWMILIQAVDVQNGIFERFGVARITQEQGLNLEALWQDIEDAASFPCVAYDPKDRLHTIAIQ